LHVGERYPESQAAFEESLELMDEDRERRWRIPRWPVEGDVRDLLDEVEGRPSEENLLLRRLWTLADPLYLKEGNDRLTAHYARWTATRIRERARNPFRLSWGDDLSELTVRHGWQVGWERTPSRDFGTFDDVVGHNHPLGRDYMPPGDALDEPARSESEDLHPETRNPRSLYAPRYAPVLLPMEGQVAVFPRGATMAVVATHFLPPDTTFHAGHPHPLPWLEPGDQAGMADRTGLFALPMRGSEAAGRRTSPFRVERRGQSDGASLVEVPIGDYVVSSESWSPSRRRAGRLRAGVLAGR